MKANYLMFKNTGFKDKWFYAFITKFEYESENSTTIYFELDVFQSWYFEINYYQSFVVRKHVTDDSIGANTLDENFGTGDYVFKNVHLLKDLSDLYYVIIASEKVPTDEHGVSFNGAIYDGIYSGLVYYATNDLTVLVNLIQAYKTYRQDALQLIQCVPYFAIQHAIGDYVQLEQTTRGNHITETYNAVFDNIDGYVPHNNKLFCSPYNIIELTNNKGESAIFKPELFTNKPTCEFEITSNFNGTPVVSCFPSNYAKIQSNILTDKIFNQDLGISIDNFPQCAWATDFYKNYIAQNSYGNNVSLGLNIAESVGMGITGGALMLTGAGTVTGAGMLTNAGVNLAQSTGQYLKDNHSAKVTPDQSRRKCFKYKYTCFSKIIRILYKS